MKLYKVCFECLNDLQLLGSLGRITAKQLINMKFCANYRTYPSCNLKPRCFDQPERSKEKLNFNAPEHTDHAHNKEPEQK